MLRGCSQWGIPVDRICFLKLSFVCFACEYRYYIVLQVCDTQLAGEYRINCISLLILSILQYSGFYIVKLYQELVLGEEIVAEARPLGSMEPSPPLAMLQRQQHPLMK